MRFGLFPTFLVVFLFSTRAFASCFATVPSGADWAFARALLTSDLAREEKREALADACRELNINDPSGEYVQTEQTPFYIALRALSSVWSVYRSAASSFSSLGESAAQKQFERRLREIRLEPKALTRIQQVYELVAYAQGETEPTLTIDTPGQMLDRVQATGKGGTCRDFANLLYWSLLQVARGQETFSVEMPSGAGNLQGAWSREIHIWVRVNVPIRKEGVLQFESFDLDTTNYRARFTPLMPRFKERSAKELNDLFESCVNVQRCLEG